jgi:hypothetical protein
MNATLAWWRDSAWHLTGLTALTAALVGLAACAPSLNWRTVAPEGADGLQAQFPCKPDVQERQVPWPGVPAGVRMRLLSCQAAERTWALSTITLSDVSLVGPGLQQWPEMLRANLAQAAGGADAVKARDLGAVQVRGMTPSSGARAWQIEAMRPDGLGRPLNMAVQAWHFSHGLTLFQATVSGPASQAAEQSSEDVANQFFQGFHFPG